MSQTNGCCQDTTVEPYPFGNDTRRAGGNRGLSIFGAKNPIPEEVTDPDKISRMFDKYRVVPYAGKDKGTAHKLLHLYDNFYRLSPTNAACINKIQAFTFGTKAFFERAVDPEYDLKIEDQPLTAQEMSAYQQALAQTVIFDGGIKEFHEKILVYLKKDGNAFVELVMTGVNGQTKAKMSVYPVNEVLYSVTEPGKEKSVMISPVWEPDYLRKYPPREVPLAPVYSTQNDVVRTVFHLKMGFGKWYGRPDSAGADLYKYREMQDSLYLIKQASSNFLGQVFIEVEDDDPVSNTAMDDEAARRAGFNSFADRIEYNFTMKGDDPQSVFVSARPVGATPMQVHQISPNTNENWYKVNSELNEQKIVRNHNVTLRFMSFDISNGFASDVFISDYLINVQPVINALRNKIMVFTNSILSYVWQYAGKTELNQFSINFGNPIQSQIDEFLKKQDRQDQPQATNVQFNNSPRSDQVQPGG